ncbi:hypothetical protein AB3662_05605 [Sorangium cellulosum]|uniref:IS66 family insertion sequence element accessory protein TnpA n=1 Tax=Sorangium cellulosum TaxID=56 RepID=UPI003D9AAE12
MEERHLAWRSDTWRDLAARWHKSRHSARVFAEQEGVNAGTLYSWSRRLGMQRSEYRKRSEKATLPTLLPVVVAPAATCRRQSQHDVSLSVILASRVPSVKTTAT